METRYVEIEVPCPPTPVALVEHYGRAIGLCELSSTREEFLRDLLALCKVMRDAGIGTEVLTPQQAAELGMLAQ